MRHIQYLNQASALIAVMIMSTPVVANHITAKSLSASLNTTLAVLIPRPITPANSGIIVSVGRSDQADFTVTKSQTETNQDMTDSNSEGDIGVSLGYRKALSTRWSLDTQFERQSNRRSKPSGAAVAADTIAQASEEEISQTIAYWASMAAIYHASITPKISVHAGGGAFVWQRENKTSIGENTATNKESGTNLLLQMGLGYRLGARAKIEANVQRFFMPNKAINRVSLGVVVQTD